MKRTLSTADTTSQSGQALAEATIVLILVLLLLGGLVEFGWAYFRYLAMQDAAGEGAAYGMMYST
jgi:Flp pilus assembly protein TadG